METGSTPRTALARASGGEGASSGGSGPWAGGSAVPPSSVPSSGSWGGRVEGSLPVSMSAKNASSSISSVMTGGSSGLSAASAAAGAGVSGGGGFFGGSGGGAATGAGSSGAASSGAGSSGTAASAVSAVCASPPGENSARMSSRAKLPSAGVPDPKSHWVSIKGSDCGSI